ncbi:hypothetical protein RvY_10484 [Ramazzottius varieornatus]|uniref:Uncharacterized protein n=1 Tax=Ramazzottius varieornatus TaxID=947166 RepID=A0A1D1VEZ7_RAMVA|nr:hypothetical protein RvY_10484 [Ramazzottius varieornatus]
MTTSLGLLSRKGLVILQKLQGAVKLASGPLGSVRTAAQWNPDAKWMYQFGGPILMPETTPDTGGY